MLPRKKRRTDPHTPAHFDLVVIGCGGGHDETNLSGYLFKPRDQSWDEGILGLEAGSGYGALKRLLSTTHSHLFASLFPSPTKSRPALSATDKAYAVYNSLRVFLLTHAHLDHAASLVISAGALPGPTKHILGAQRVLQDLETCIFAPGRCWPNIVGWGENGHSHADIAGENTTGGILRALPVAPTRHDEASDRDGEYTDVGAGIKGVQVRVVPLAHGTTGHVHHPKDEKPNGHQNGCEQEVYRSSAFFIRHARTRHEFLFFGDVEADPSTPPISSQPIPISPISSPVPPTEDSSPIRPFLHPIWKHTAHLLAHSRLHTLFIECSWPAGRPTAHLFGHLGVEQLRAEMVVLAREVVKAREKLATSVNGESLVVPDVPVSAAVPVPVSSVNSKAARPRARRARTESPPRSGRGTKRKAVPAPPLPPSTHTPIIPTPTPPLSEHPSLLDLSPKPASPLVGALTGLRVIIIHCKEPPPSFALSGVPTIADFIVRQLRDGVPSMGIPPDESGVEWVAAHQGDEFAL